MKRIVVFLQPVRAFLPSSGVGRHINGMVRELASRSDVDVTLLFSKQWLQDDGRLPRNCPLRDLPFRTFALPERLVERSWKLSGMPSIDRFLKNADVLYCPSDTAFPQTSVPSFVTIHDIHPLDPLYPAYARNPRFFSQQRRWERWVPKAFATSRGILTVSEFCKSRMQDLLPQCTKPIHVVGNGVDPHFFELGKRDIASCRRPGDWSYVIVVGGLTDRKGAAETLDVARRLQELGSDLRIVVVGKSEAKWVDAARSHPNVIQAGPLPDDLLGEYLRAATALLFLSHYEGFGIPIIEAMAAGVPVVCSNTSSLPEIAGDVGYAFRIRDSVEIATLLSSLASSRLNDPVKSNRVEAGLERARAFSWTACVNRLLKFLFN